MRVLPDLLALRTLGRGRQQSGVERIRPPPMQTRTRPYHTRTLGLRPLRFHALPQAPVRVGAWEPLVERLFL